ncbi:helix-turn-helix domain-containing protein [Humitalea sp. 24SJ18S-53]|uniref:helix-turn-helix domain-containing protein n=1 Tax=Humitalea sp. 24SJ18S-53 TaxID=3422307 RepID=UPI003D665B19
MLNARRVCADLGFVADRVGSSRRGLQRALALQGASFSTLRDEERLGRARLLLEAGENPIGEIATGRGYAEAAAFSRALRKRFGVGSRGFRRQPVGET